MLSFEFFLNAWIVVIRARWKLWFHPYKITFEVNIVVSFVLNYGQGKKNWVSLVQLQSLSQTYVMSQQASLM
jgi:hypothetical protein